MAKYGEIEEYAGMVHATGSVTETANSPTETANSPGLDCKNVEQVAVIGLAGTALVPSDTIDIKVQESDDDAATDPYTDVTGAAFAQLVDTDDGKVVYGKIRTNVAGRKRWLRIAYNRGGHTPPAVNALPATEFSV
jgi:hypothetical protein